MAAHVIDLLKTDDQRDAVHRTVQALTEGGLAIIPTETVYGLAASALDPAAVRRMAELKERDLKPFALAVRNEEEALDYVPGMSSKARRLARRCWPGPATLVFDIDRPRSLVSQFDGDVRKHLCGQGTLGLRSPDHAFFHSVQHLLVGPIVLTSANLAGKPEAKSGRDAVEQLEDSVDLIIDAGECRFQQPSTVAKVAGDEIEVLREGVISKSALEQLTKRLFIFVCTGNTCRSPMAELLFRQRLSKKLSCAPEALDAAGYVIESAGLAAYPGGPSSAEAQQVMKARGLSLADHASQPLTEGMIAQADRLFVMTRLHRQAIVDHAPQAAARTELLCRDQDVSDPFGGTFDQYQQCAKQMEDQMDGWIDQLLAEE